jgi:hemerythrin-like domain-containing protein
MTRPRMNGYGFPHKGLRLALSRLVVVSGNTDYSDDSSLNALKTLAKEVIELLHFHAVAEDSVILPALEERVPGSTATNVEDHRVLEDEISEFAEQLEGITIASVPASGAKFYESVTRFFANYINHMAMEESDMNALIWKNFSDEEIMSWQGRIMSTLTPAQISSFFKYMVPALNPFERNIMLSGFKANAPAEFFNSVIGMLKEHMTESEHSQMVARLS